MTTMRTNERDLAYALQRAGCRVIRSKAYIAYYATPSGRTLPPIPAGRPNKEVDVNCLSRLRRALDADGIDLWAVVAAEKGGNGKTGQAPTQAHLHDFRVLKDGTRVCSSCGESVEAPPAAPLKASIGEAIAAKNDAAAPTKTCSRCGQAKPTNEFYPGVGGTGLRHLCKQCWNDERNSKRLPQSTSPSTPPSPSIGGRPFWSKHPPEKKLAAVRDALAKGVGVGGPKGGPLSSGQVALELAVKYGTAWSTIYTWVAHVRKAGYDLSKPIPDEAARIFDVRDDAAHRRKVGRSLRKAAAARRRKSVEDGMKVCGVCNERKPVEEFHKDGAHKNGTLRYKGRCKACTNITRSVNPRPTPGPTPHRRDGETSAILAELDAATGDLDALTEVMAKHNLTPVAIRSMREAAKARSVELEEIRKDPAKAMDRIAALEAKMEKLVKDLGG